MIRILRRGLGAGIVLALACAAAALATTYRGAGVDDPEMPVKAKVSAQGAVRFAYRQVLVECANGDRVRQGGGVHSTALTETARFRDTIEQESDGAVATSFVRGKVGGRRAKGTLTYGLVYEGGECHSGELEWRAKRK